MARPSNFDPEVIVRKLVRNHSLTLGEALEISYKGMIYDDLTEEDRDKIDMRTRKYILTGEL